MSSFRSKGSVSDERVRIGVTSELARHAWAAGHTTNVVVDQGVVHLWGHVDTKPVKDAMGIAAENVPGVRRVVNNLTILPAEGRMGL